MTLDGETLVAVATSQTPLGLLRTLDEVVGVLAAAEKAERVSRS